MSTPRDRDRDGFDDGRADGPAGWQEPEHLGREGEQTGQGAAGQGAQPARDEARGAAWQPPGWDLPAVEPQRPAPPSPTPPSPGAEEPQAWQPPVTEQRTSDVPPAPPVPHQQGEWNLVRPGHEQITAPPADPSSTQAWAQQVGWLLSDGTTPEDASLLPLLRSAPVRPGKDDRPSRVLRGRGNGLELVAFDIASPMGRSWLSTHAVTAAPVLGTVPGFRLSPARMWRHGTGGLLQIPSPDPEFDRRWVLLAAEDGPQVRRLVEDPLVRQSLLGTDDGDELWSAAGFVAAVRPDGNRPQLIEHHARLLAAVVGALAAAG
jgi:hypothetical protein